MFLVGSSDRWSWGEDAFPPVAFCVQALVQDGVGVPPFDRHGDGDGRLRAAGLDAVVWRDWLTSILEAHAMLAEAAHRLGSGTDRGAIRASAHLAGEVLRVPGSFCPGPPELRDRLGELWQAYAPVGEAWKRRVSEGVRDRLAPGPRRWLWKALLPFHDRLPTISVFLVAYVEPVVMALPPTACLIAPASEPEAYGRQIVAAASGLASAADEENTYVDSGL